MQKIQSFVQEGNTTLTISGSAGTITRKVQGSFPSATVTVYNAGTVVLASIFSDNSSTPKANPFVASADGTFFFYAANGRYDVEYSGGGLPSPFTAGDILAFDGQVGLDGADYDITQLANDFISVKRYGALGDGTRVFDAAMTNGSPTLTSATANFTSANIGMLVVVEGAAAASATLIATILSIGGPTTATLSVSASTTVTNVQSIWASNDTTAIQTALDENDKIYLPDGIYGISILRLKLGNQILGSGASTAFLCRLLAGAGGSGIAMTTNEAAQSIGLYDFCYIGSHVGGNVDGIDLGTQGSAYRLANNSEINNVRVMAVSAIGMDLGVNVAEIGQVWIQNFPGQGTPDALSIPSSVGFKCVDTMLIADLISVEGHWESSCVDLGAGDSEIDVIQAEPTGVYGSADIVNINATFQTINRLFAVQWNATASTRRDFVRIGNGQQAINIGQIVNASFAPITLTNMVNDLTNSVTLPADASHWTVSNYYNDQRNTVLWNDTYKVMHGKRLAFGLQLPVAANDLALTYVGNIAQVSGNTQINAITTTDWPVFSEITLIFTGTPLIKHNTAGGAGTAPIFLQGLIDLQMVANGVLKLVYNGTVWYQVSYSPNAALWSAFSPTYSSDVGNAATTFSGAVTTTQARYTKIGQTAVVTVRFTATLNAVTPISIFLTVPTIIRPANDVTYSTCLVANGATYESGIMRTRNDLTSIEINRTNFAAWGSGNAVVASISFTYEVTG